MVNKNVKKKNNIRKKLGRSQEAKYWIFYLTCVTTTD